VVGADGKIDWLRFFSSRPVESCLVYFCTSVDGRWYRGLVGRMIYVINERSIFDRDF
jgi:hypothetical protein